MFNSYFGKLHMETSSSGLSDGYVLGLDLGSHSLGWAILPLDADNKPQQILRAGVRIFEAGKDATRDQILQGLDKQKSRAADRRQKRLPRRQFWRRARRRYNVLKCLLAHGLLRPPGDLDIRQPADQDRFLKSIDADLHARLRQDVPAQRRHLWEQVWLYELRASSLERKLDPLELGRVFYHLAQRRGFLSNRKTDDTEGDSDKAKKPKRRKKAKPADAAVSQDQPEVANDQDKKEDPKKVKEAIEKLDRDIEQAIAVPTKRTLGYYFARCVHPQEQRIRQRWIGRSAAESKYNYEAEFNAIWEAQKVHHPELLTDDFHRALSRREETTSIFYQRPLKPAGHLIGHCDLEPRRKRAPQAIPLVQRFRLLQKVNDLMVMDPDGRDWRRLKTGKNGDPNERRTLNDALSTQGDMTFHQVRTLLGLKTRKFDKKTGEVLSPGHDFNLETGPEKDKGLPGDRTYKKIADADAQAPGILDRWKAMSERQQENLILDLLEFRSTAALAEHLIARGFSQTQATALAKVKPEEKRCALSRRAIARLLPFMEEGLPFATAKEEIPQYRAVQKRRTDVHDLLPRVMATDHKHLKDVPAFKGAHDLRNPAVTRGLAELRKVVNGIIRRYGKPASIRIELGRELKKTPTKRALLSKDIEARRKARDDAAKSLMSDHGFEESEIREADKQKYLLYREQNGPAGPGTCPYCGQHMDPSGIRSGALQIDHIVPHSVCLDNTMLNKVLCHADCNALKAKQTPMQAWGRDPQRMRQIELAVAKLPPRKRQRFGWTDEDLHKEYGDDFTRRQLQDTQYASRLAAEYLGLLYGGVIDESGIRRVQTPSGGVTAILRTEWGLNGVIPSLPDSPAYKIPEQINLEEKLRTDHRHHAVDAIVVALTDQRTVGFLNRAAATIEQAERNRQDVRDSKGHVRRRFAEFTNSQMPWGTTQSFPAEVRTAVASINVSHRANHKLNGPLHDQSNYSKRFEIAAAASTNTSTKRRRRKPPTPQVERRIRVPLTKLAENNLGSIVDVHVRQAISNKLEEHKQRHACGQAGKPKPAKFDLTKVWVADTDYPVLGQTPDGKPVYVKSVRIRVGAKPVTLAQGSAYERHVKPGENHHMTVLACVDSQGNELEWVQGELVSRLDAMRRKRAGQPIIDTTELPLRKFKFSLRPGDILDITRRNQTKRLHVVRSISDKRIEYVTIQDARKSTQIQPPKREKGDKSGPRNRAALEAANPNQWLITTVIDDLRRFKARKVTITPLGEVLPAND
ncbi:MAG: type II CRISPR RNA-guided endonuclease Cas9 [Phycisphaeraceae bacterium]